MFTLNEHIEYLMMHHDCVVIPGWGALVAQYSESFYDSNRRLLEKPVRQVGFNASVSHNDGLLAQSLVRREGLAYDEAVRFIEQSVTTFRQQLAQGGELGMGRLGFFHADSEGRFEFIPFYHEMCNDQYFGLRSVRFTPLEELEREADVAPAKPAEPARGAIVRPNWLSRRVLQTAASVAVLLGLGVLLSTPVLVNRHPHDAASLSLPAVSVPHTTSVPEATASQATTATARTAAETTHAQPPVAPGAELLLDEGGKYYLVVSTLTSTKQVDKFLEVHPELQGHTYVEHSGKHYRVCVARAQDPAALYAFKNTLPKAYSQAWVYQVK
ncbi:MAG: hypothetical protein IJT30_06480 [Muribaculaceae bacterium]|nr:hypothetical protein [Muribaculaceae bacterium]